MPNNFKTLPGKCKAIAENSFHHWSFFFSLMKLCFESQYWDTSSYHKFHYKSAQKDHYSRPQLVWDLGLVAILVVLTNICCIAMWVQSKDELYTTEEDILLQSVRIIKERGAKLSSTWQDSTGQWYSDNADKWGSVWWSSDPSLHILNFNIILRRNVKWKWVSPQYQFHHDFDSCVVLVHM